MGKNHLRKGENRIRPLDHRGVKTIGPTYDETNPLFTAGEELFDGVGKTA